MPRLIDDKRVVHFWEARSQGLTISAAAKKAGISYSHARRINSGESTRHEQTKIRLNEAGVVRATIPVDKLSPEARKALDDFGTFRLRYLGHQPTPWQVDAANQIVRIMDGTAQSEDPYTKHYIVINCPPGAGKTSLLRDICTWLICRNRSIRILWGSRTENQSKDNVELIRNMLASPVRLFVADEEKRRRHAVDPAGCMVDDYGRFRPTKAGAWSSDAFTVAQHGDVTGTQKEKTMAAYGMDSGFLGGRYDISVWDDLIDIKNYRNLDMRDKLQRWWDTQAENRIEPGGLVVLLGQRLSPDDLYRYCLNKQAIVFDDNGDEIHSDEPARKYTHIVYQAHDETRCQGIHTPKTAKAWPDGCLLDPTGLRWQELRAAQHNNDADYRIVYQQEDIDPDRALVRRVWIDGGTDTDGTQYLGCWDDNRPPFTHPGLRGTYWNSVTVDPSGARLWAVQTWAAHHQTGYRFLIGSHSGSMTADQLLDADPNTGGWTGLLEDWAVLHKKIGLPLSHVIIENNAAQRYLLAYDFFRRWCSYHRIQPVAHKTYTTTRLDPDRGIETLRTPFRLNQIRLPGTQAGRAMSKRLVDEAVAFPLGATTDQLMACWFQHFWLPAHGRPRHAPTVKPRPSWFAGGTQLKAVS